MALVGFDDLARFILVHQPSASICPVLDCKKAVDSDQAGFQPDCGKGGSHVAGN